MVWLSGDSDRASGNPIAIAIGTFDYRYRSLVVGTQSIQREGAGVPSRINNLGTVHDATWAEVRVEASVQEVLHLVERHALVKAALEHLAGCVLGSSAEGSCEG